MDTVYMISFHLDDGWLFQTGVMADNFGGCIAVIKQIMSRDNWPLHFTIKGPYPTSVETGGRRFETRTYAWTRYRAAPRRLA